MENPKVNDKRQVKLEHMLSSDYIPFLEGRPSREVPIEKNDEVDVAIALNTTNSLEEFLEFV